MLFHPSRKSSKLNTLIIHIFAYKLRYLLKLLQLVFWLLLLEVCQKQDMKCRKHLLKSVESTFYQIFRETQLIKINECHLLLILSTVLSLYHKLFLLMLHRSIPYLSLYLFDPHQGIPMHFYTSTLSLYFLTFSPYILLISIQICYISSNYIHFLLNLKKLELPSLLIL